MVENMLSIQVVVLLGKFLILTLKTKLKKKNNLFSKGHPLGATGLAQCAELCWQLRGQAEARQVQNVKYALQHNIGLGGAVVVGIYALGFGAPKSPSTQFPSHKSSKFFQDIQERLKGIMMTDYIIMILSQKYIKLIFLKENKGMATKINSTIGFEVIGDNNQKFIYVLDTKNGNAQLLINDNCK